MAAAYSSPYKVLSMRFIRNSSTVARTFFTFLLLFSHFTSKTKTTMLKKFWPQRLNWVVNAQQVFAFT